jgi:hypothetical protein
MSVTNTPHLNFHGDARAALEFYHSVFGGQLMIATYGQFGIPQDDPDGGPVTLGPVAADSPDADRVAFGVVAGGNGFRVAAYDVFGATGGGIAGASAQTARRASGLTHDEPFFLLLKRRHHRRDQRAVGQARRRRHRDRTASGRPVRGTALRHAHRPLRHHLDLRRHPRPLTIPEAAGTPSFGRIRSELSRGFRRQPVHHLATRRSARSACVKGKRVSTSKPHRAAAMSALVGRGVVA